jgi:hypothetical protein
VGGYLYLVEFTYNNGYHTSLKMCSFEALYGKKCDTLVSWDNLADRVVLGPKMLKKMEENVAKIKLNLKALYDRKKRYINKGITPRKFRVREHVFLKVKPK